MPEGGDSKSTAEAATLAAGVVEGESDTAQVFISYASADSSIANTACHALESAGVKCWIAPRDVIPGDLYAADIVHAIDTTRMVVLVLSQHAADSAHVLREVERASSKRHPILAFRIDNAPLPDGLEYFLNTSQWLDANTTGADRGLPRLVDAVKGALGKRTAAVPVNQGPPEVTRAEKRFRPILLALAVFLAVALAYVGVDRFWPSKRVEESTLSAVATPASPADSSVAPTLNNKSIAVLPFADMSERKDQEYMSDGLAEELLNLLSQVPDLKVIARTSSFSFKGQNIEIAEIAKKLNVAHVLEGSVRKSGNTLRITVQLIRAADSTHLWSQTYDRPMTDVFKVQDEIANAIVQALQIQLAGGELSRRKGGTQNFEAYQLYLQAMSAWNKNNRSSSDAAGAYLEKAIKLDPGFGMAWSRLSANVSLQADNGYISAKEGYERSRQLAQHALQLSPDLAIAHSQLGYIHLKLDWDWAAAQAESQRALAIDPTDPYVLLAAGMLSYTLGRWDDAERQLHAALVRDPLHPYVLWNLGFTYYGAGRFAEAETTYRELLEVAPGFLWTHGYLGKTLLMQGKPAAALAMVQQEVDEVERLGYLPVVLQAAGHQAEADEALQAQIATWADTGAYLVATTYAYRGERELALQWLERAYVQKDGGLTELLGEQLFKGMAGDPRYKTFLHKMNLPE